MTIINIHDISLNFAPKLCFENFSANIIVGQKIALIGNNGSGKSSLLKIIEGQIEPGVGHINMPQKIKISSVAQIIVEHSNLSGGERFNKELSQILSADPDLLLLDEPTNHLDSRNRRALINMVRRFAGTVIIATHDKELIDQALDEIWHIDNGKIHKFSGSYNNYMQEQALERKKLLLNIRKLGQKQKSLHGKLMQEQERASKSKQYGEKKYADDKINLKARKRKGQTTTGNKKRVLSDGRNECLSKLDEIYIPSAIIPKFAFDQKQIATDKMLVDINNGSCGYDIEILKNVYLQVKSRERVAIIGSNGSGKTTLVRAILSDLKITKTGSWQVPFKEDIGYLDQHYSIFTMDSPFDEIKSRMPYSTDAEIRMHLNNYLFRSNQQVHAEIQTLSGGERARLCMAIIASTPFQLLILDEPTNNIDIETKQHLIDVLNKYQGGLLVISHDQEFLEKVGISFEYGVKT